MYARIYNNALQNYQKNTTTQPALHIARNARHALITHSLPPSKLLLLPQSLFQFPDAPLQPHSFLRIPL